MTDYRQFSVAHDPYRLRDITVIALAPAGYGHRFQWRGHPHDPNYSQQVGDAAAF
jgi:hypothetical protein